jgi:hypothetical protein
MCYYQVFKKDSIPWNQQGLTGSIRTDIKLHGKSYFRL